MRKFLIPPEQEGYSVKDGNEVVSVMLDGGVSRSRADIRNSSSRVTCTWKTNGFGYEYIRTFFKVGTSSAALPFLIDLYGEFETLTEHVVKFVPGSMTLSSQRGNSFVVNAELEVMPNAADFAYQENMMILYDNLDFELAWFFDALEKTANVDFPEWWGPLPTGIPRLIESRNWGTGDQTVLLEITPVVGDDGAYYLSMATAHGKLIEIKNNLGIIEFWFGGILRASWAQGFVKTRIHITFDKNASTIVAFYKNNTYFTGFSSTGTAIQHNFSGDVGVCGDRSGNNHSYNAATIFKILSGLYMDFDTANAVTGANLIFDGLNF